MTDMTFESNSADDGGAAANVSGEPVYEDCLFRSNTADFGGAVANLGSCATITGSRFLVNQAEVYGGGVYNDEGAPTVGSSLFVGNTSGSGGGMFNFVSESLAVNCVYTGNVGKIEGGAIGNVAGGSTMVNCTLSTNTAPRGGGIYSALTGSIVFNSIIWANSGGSIFDEFGETGVWHSNVDGIPLIFGNIHEDPLFIDPLGPDGIAGTEDDDLRLGAGSPCIDAGSNAWVPRGIDTDFDGAARFFDDVTVPDTGAPPDDAPIVDMGAFEYHGCTADCAPSTGDGAVDVVDLLLLLGGDLACDLDNDGTTDAVDLLLMLGAWGDCP